MTAPVPTTPETPADTLRRAAAKVREVGAKASKNVCPTWTYSAVRHIARNVDLDCAKHDTAEEIDPDCEVWDRYNDSPWISLVDAKVAEPLVAWLELEAGWGDEASSQSVDFARVLLGEAS